MKARMSLLRLCWCKQECKHPHSKVAEYGVTRKGKHADVKEEKDANSKPYLYQSQAWQRKTIQHQTVYGNTSSYTNMSVPIGVSGRRSSHVLCISLYADVETAAV